MKKVKRIRNNGKLIYFSDLELGVIENKVEAAHVKSFSDYIRQTALGYPIYNINNDELRNLNRQIARIGNNINQIAKVFNTSGHNYQDAKRLKKEFQKLKNEIHFAIDKFYNLGGV